ncbi:MAG: amidophosphoribosyltransferase [Solibacterales bacterium]|nr:amidophosphoribosyltransferase [Bryobacterales bacterium]|tara:strand:- start:11428 stop:12858 length:1431 start_codon:yes stop_codon:yes gene_type:complete
MKTTNVSDHFHEECGVFGIYGHPEAANLAYLGLYALQHRGQESAGICSTDGERLHCRKDMGLVAEIFTESVLSELRGANAIGHTRYSTAGQSARLNAQPFLVECSKGQIAVAHNGNLTNAIDIRRDLEMSGSIFQANSDTEVIVHLIARSQEDNLEHALRESLLRMEGAYSLAVLSKEGLIVARDPYGFRPMAFGQIEHNGHTAYVFASETCAFDLIGATYIDDVQPGEMITITDSGELHRKRFAPVQDRHHCVFEHVYFARPDSVVFGRSVQKSRELLGRLLAREAPVEADIVVPLPDSGVDAAIGYAAESGLPYRMGLIRNHYVGRTFIEPKQSIRDFGVKLKLNPVRGVIEGKRVILVDDSLVRGTTSQKIVRIVRQAGAKEVHLRISCPPTISPCYYGVDTPDKNELIAANHSIDRIRDHTEADSLAYLSLEGLKQAVQDVQGEYCYACYTGQYPTDLVGIEQLLADSREKK